MADADFSTAKLDIINEYEVIYEQLNAAKAICNAAEILCALERSPEHQDTHPSHNIRTGGGYAHGRRLYDDTLPILLRQAAYLIDAANNDADCMREGAITALARSKEAGHA